MKKLLIVLMTTALLVSLFVIPANAAGDMEVLKGTPCVDGKIDDMYLESLCLGIFQPNIVAHSWGSGAANTVDTANMYVLWDDTGMYFCCQVFDSSIYNISKEDATAAPHNWSGSFAMGCDGVNLCFWMPDNSFFFVMLPAYGEWIDIENTDFDAWFNREGVRIASEIAADGESYVVEAYLPFADDVDAPIANIGFHFIVENCGRKADKGGYGSFGGLGDSGYYSGHKFELLSTQVTGAPSGEIETTAPETEAPETDAPVTDAPVTDAPVTDAPVTDAPVTDAPVTDAPVTDAPATDAPATDAPETTPNPENPDAPQTADAVVIFAVVALCAATALVVISKKRTA